VTAPWTKCDLDVKPSAVCTVEADCVWSRRIVVGRFPLETPDDYSGLGFDFAKIMTQMSSEFFAARFHDNRLTQNGSDSGKLTVQGITTQI